MFFLFVILINIFSCAVPNLNLLYQQMHLQSNFSDDPLIPIFQSLEDFLHTVGISFYFSKEGQKCMGGAKEDKNSYFDLFSYSGKGISELGLEAECYLYNKSNINTQYFLIMYQYDPSAFEEFFDDGYVYSYINHTTFYTGVCLFEECTDFVNLIFNRTAAPLFYDFIYKEAKMVDLQVIVKKTQKPTYQEEIELGFKNEYLTFYILIFLIAVLCCIYLAIGIFTVCISTAQNKQSQQKLVPYPSYDSSYDDEEEDEDSFGNNFGDSKDRTSNNVFGTIEAEETKDIRYQGCASFFQTVVDFFNVMTNMIILSTKKNKYMNDQDLEVVSFFKCIALLFITYFQNFDTLIKIPARDFENGDFYKHIYFFFMKLSSFASDCYLCLDGLTMIYKFMNYIKKNVIEKNEQSISIKVLLKFYIRVIVKVIVFLILYFVMGVCAKFFLRLIASDAIYEYTTNKIFNIQNTKNLEYFIIPGINFYIGYLPNQYINFFAYNRFLVMQVNEFYIFTIVILIFYLCYKFRSPLFDIIIVVIFILNYISNYFTCVSDLPREKEKYNFNRVARSLISVRYPHVIFDVYFIGVLTGMVFFYFKDVISKTPIISEEYSPFKLCYHVMTAIDSLAPFLKLGISYLMLGLLLVLSSSFYFLCRFVHHDLLFDFDMLCQFLFFYEKGVFLLIYCLLIILLETYNDDSSIKHLIKSNIFTHISRVSFCFVCSVSAFTYEAYCIFNFQLKLCYQNTWFITFGLFMFLYVFSLILTLVLELPLRKLLKNIIFYYEGKKSKKAISTRTTSQKTKNNIVNSIE